MPERFNEKRLNAVNRMALNGNFEALNFILPQVRGLNAAEKLRLLARAYENKALSYSCVEGSVSLINSCLVPLWELQEIGYRAIASELIKRAEELEK